MGRDMNAHEGARRKQDALDTLESSRKAVLLIGRRALLLRLLRGGRATADDVRDAVALPDGMNPRVFGEVPGALARLGIIRATGAFAKSTRPARHASWLTVWELADRQAAVDWLRSHPDPAAPPGGEQLGLFQDEPAAANGAGFDGRA
jgi:hypothetical protein